MTRNRFRLLKKFFAHSNSKIIEKLKQNGFAIVENHTYIIWRRIDYE